MQLNSQQDLALQNFSAFLTSKEKFFILEGFSGTGKSTVLNFFLSGYLKTQKLKAKISSKHKTKNFYFAATTNQAATELSNKIKDAEVTTFHSLFSLQVGRNYKTGETFLRKTSNTTPLKGSSNILVIDEASQLSLSDIKLINSLTPDAKVVLVGDPAQLRSVSDPDFDVFNAISTNNSIKNSLTKIERNDNPIGLFAGEYREWLYSKDFPANPPALPQENDHIRYLNTDKAEKFIQKTFRDFSADKSHLILAWRNKTVSAYNNYIQNLRYASDYFLSGQYIIANSRLEDPKTLSTLIGNNQTVKVVSVLNTSLIYFDAEISNLSFEYDEYLVWEKYSNKTAKVKSIRSMTEFKEVMNFLAARKNWKLFFKLQNTFTYFRPASSMTIHKAQGMTKNTVFINLSDLGACNDADTFARLMYVGISRAKSKVYLIGDLPDHYKT